MPISRYDPSAPASRVPSQEVSAMNNSPYADNDQNETSSQCSMRIESSGMLLYMFISSGFFLSYIPHVIKQNNVLINLLAHVFSLIIIPGSRNDGLTSKSKEDNSN